MSEQRFTLTNVRPWGGAVSDIVIEGGRIAEVRAAFSGQPAAAGDIDGGGAVALPGFINSHSHVDKSWWGEPWVGYTYKDNPTVEGWIANEREQRDKYNIPNVNSTTHVLRQFLRQGTTATRTHIDVDLRLGLRGLEIVKEAMAEVGDAIQVETVAFPQDGVLRRPGVMKLLDEAAKAGVDKVGGLDPGTIDRDVEAQLDGLFDIAVNRGVGIDLHLHDFGSLGIYEFRQVMRRTIDAGLQGKVTISHGFVLGTLPQAVQDEIVAGLAEAGVSWTTVAMGGTAPLPWRKMVDASVPLGLGTDGIRDLWSPFGDGDMLRVAHNFARLSGLRHNRQLIDSVALATRGGAHFVGRDTHDLVQGARADIVLIDAENVPDALVRVPPRKLVLSGGKTVTRDGQVVV